MISNGVSDRQDCRQSTRTCVEVYLPGGKRVTLTTTPKARLGFAVSLADTPTANWSSKIR
jgi:hypothetical protein